MFSSDEDQLQGDLFLEIAIQQQEKTEEATTKMEKVMRDMKRCFDEEVRKEHRLGEKLRGEMKELKVQVESVRDAYSEACDQLEITQSELQAEVVKLNDDLQQERTIGGQLEEQAELRAQRLEAKIDRAEREREELLQQRAELQGKVRSLTDSILELEPKRAQLWAQVAGLQDDQGELQAELDAVEEEALRLEQQLALATSQCAALQARLDVAETAGARLLKERDFLRAKVAKLTGEVVASSGKVVHWREEVYAAESAKVQLVAQVASMEGQREALQHQLQSGQERVRQLTETVREERAASARTHDQQVAISAEVDKLRVQVKQAEDSRAELARRAETAAAKLRRLEVHAASAEASRKKTEELTVEELVRGGGLQERIKALQDETSAAQKQQLQLHTDIGWLAEQVRAAQAETATLEQKVAAAETAERKEAQLTELAAQQDELGELLAASERARRGLEEELQQLKEEAEAQVHAA